MPPMIHWFRRDLRAHDNAALAVAIAESGGATIPLFIIDPAILALGAVGDARTHFMLESLRALDATLRGAGGRLIVRRGEPLPVLLDLLRECGAAGVVWNRDYTPRAIARDTQVKSELQAQGFSARSFKDQVVFEMDELLTNGGKPYTVYTPYRRNWQARVDADPSLVADHLPANALRLRTPEDIKGDPIPTLNDLGRTLAQEVIEPGEPAGLKRLERFAAGDAGGIGDYAEGRNRLADDATSRLAPHLRWGTVSVRACVRAALDRERATRSDEVRKGAASWAGELAWRDFYQQILYNFPQVLREPFKQQFARFPYDNDESLFAAWREGRTGYPVVDAAMRQLNREAFMHNRARMIVASFLTKDLLVDYKLGERYFMRQLACGDLAANNGGWQWVAGCGNDAQPYFRIFNPVSQGQKFDPVGAYVRRYIPELADVPDTFIHEPWKMSEALQRQSGVQIGRDYPQPIVDHNERRAEALARAKSI